MKQHKRNFLPHLALGWLFCYNYSFLFVKSTFILYKKNHTTILEANFSTNIQNKTKSSEKITTSRKITNLPLPRKQRVPF